jgi:hypothetical protein
MHRPKGRSGGGDSHGLGVCVSQQPEVARTGPEESADSGLSKRRRNPTFTLLRLTAWRVQIICEAQCPPASSPIRWFTG